MNLAELLARITNELSTIDSDELSSLLDELRAWARTASEGDITADVVAQLTSVNEAVASITAEQAARDQAADELATQAAAQLAGILGQDGDNAEPAESGESIDPGDDGEAGRAHEEPPATPAGDNAPPPPPVEDRTPVAAGARAAATRPASLAQARTRIPARAAARPSAPAFAAGRLVASAALGGREAGEALNPQELAVGMARRWESLGKARGVEDEDVIVASVQVEYPDDRRLSHAMDPQDTMARIDAVVASLIEARRDGVDVASLTAAGGLCAPTEGYYDVLQVASTATPVLDNLPKFGADRGGIRFVPPPSLADTLSSVGTVTVAQDAAGGAASVKACLNVACPGVSEVLTIAAYACLEFNNFSARTYPERVQALTQDSAAQHARLNETILLNAFGANSTAVTAASGLSSTRDLIAKFSQASAGLRSRQRVAIDFPLDLYLPYWVPNVAIGDMARTLQDDPFEAAATARADFELAMRAINVNVTWYMDSATGASQLFGAQGAGAITAYPTNIVGYLHPAGSFVALDGGELNIGLVRDSLLTMGAAADAFGTGSPIIPGNRFRQFMENWINAAFVGREALAITIPTGQTGAYAAAVTVTPPG